MFEFAIRQPIILSAAILIVTLFGAISVSRVSVQMTPDVEDRVVSVDTRWPGATPQDIEQEILIEQEKYLRNIPGLQRMVSEAQMGRAQIELEFAFSMNVSDALLLVNNALSQVSTYPENVDEPRLVSASFTSDPFLFYGITPLPGNPHDVDIRKMYDFIDNNALDAVERVPGVAESFLSGGSRRQINLFVDPAKLAQREVSIPELRQAIRSRNRNVSGGDIASGRRNYMVRTMGRFRSIEEIEETIIADRDGAQVRFSDIGFVELGVAEPRTFSRVNGQTALYSGIRKQPGANVIEIRDGVEAVVAKLNQTVLRPAGIEMYLVSQDVRYIEEAAAQVRQNLIIGAVLATCVLFLFLRSWSATAIGAAGIPICTLVAFLGLLLTGRTINVISLSGIAFAIGMTLDNGIVVLENTARHMAEGHSRYQATLAGVREVWPAVLASTLTTVFVFLPILFIELEAGQLYSDIAVAISASILMSMMYAVTVIPAASARLLNLASSAQAAARPNFIARWLDVLLYRLTHTGGWIMAAPSRCAATAASIIALGAGIFILLSPPAEYLPEAEEPKIFAFAFPPAGANLAEVEQIMNQIGDEIIPAIKQNPQDFAAGKAKYPAVKNVVQFANTGRQLSIMESQKANEAQQLVEKISGYLSKIPGVFGFVSKGSIFSGNRGGTRSINVDIAGPDLQALFDTASRLFQLAQEKLPGAQIRTDPSSLSMEQAMLEIRPDWNRAAELGFNTAELGYTVWAFADGAFVDEFFIDDEKVDMFLYSTQGVIDRPEDLHHLQIYSPEGHLVPLSSISSIVQNVNTNRIRRVDGQRTVTVSVVPPSDIPLEQGVEIVENDIIAILRNQGGISAGNTIAISGASDKLVATREALSGNFVVAILISYMLMAAILSHWGLPLLIMATVPLGVSGGVLGLWLLNLVGGHVDIVGLQSFRQPFDMITMMGFLILIGTVVNNPILIVDRTSKNVEQKNMPAAEAVLEAVRARFRPIMMTTVTTVCGISPLVLLPGAGSELYRGIGAIVLFGLLFSALVTLTFLPALLVLYYRVQSIWSARMARAA